MLVSPHGCQLVPDRLLEPRTDGPAKVARILGRSARERQGTKETEGGAARAWRKGREVPFSTGWSSPAAVQVNVLEERTRKQFVGFFCVQDCKSTPTQVAALQQARFAK